MNKTKLRKKFISLRKNKNIFNIEIKKEILKIISNKFVFKNKTIAGYFPVNHEISIINLLKDLEKKNNKIVFPRIKNNNLMEFYRWNKIDFLTTNNFGIPEPNMSKKVEKPDIIFIPIVAFDNYKNRLGYGGGFYDRYLERMSKKKKFMTIGIAFSFQKINKVPINRYDRKLDLILTEKSYIK